MRRFTDRIGEKILDFVTNEAIKEDANDRLNDPASAVSDARDRFLDYFADRTKTYLIAAFLILVVIGITDYLLCGAVPDQTYGLSLDLFGAVVLARGLLKGPYGIASESAQYWSSSPPLRRALAEDSADGVWGVTLLVTGIALQFISVAGISIFHFQKCLV